jgi:hypothetical protein
VKVSNCSDDKALMIFVHDVSATLQTLRLSNCTSSTYSQLSETTFSNLRSVHVADCTSEAAALLIVNSPALQDLKLECLSTPADAVLRRLPEKHPHLQLLSINSCRFSNEEALRIPLATLTALMDVDCTALGNVFTDACVTTLVTAAAQLKTLTLSMCTGLTDAAMEAIANQCTNLVKFAVSPCGHVTLFGVQRVVVSRPHLTHLMLFSAGQKLSETWNAVALAAVLSGCDAVLHLSLRGMPVDATVLLALKAHCRNLRSLRVLDMNPASDLHLFAEVAQHAAQLKILVVDKADRQLFPVISTLTVFTDGRLID